LDRGVGEKVGGMGGVERGAKERGGGKGG
jgi:hypothetical protein